MKAVFCRAYGPPGLLRIEEAGKPVPGDDQVLIEVHAASINPLDWRLMKGRPLFPRLFFGLGRPKDPRLGRDVAGRVEAAGRNVARLRRGDEVFGNCLGALAGYACASESKLALKPAGVTFEQAASVPVAGLTALQGLRDKGRLQPGQKVLINGAAGGVGTFAVQIAKWLGAEVTGVCSTGNVERIRSLGADRVIDYTREDFTRSGRRYDLLFDCIVNHTLRACRRVLTPGGRYLMVGAPHSTWTLGLLAQPIQALAASPFVSQKLLMFIANSNRDDLAFLGELMASGKMTPVIDRRYRLREAPDALEHLERGHARGKVVITVEEDDRA